MEQKSLYALINSHPLLSQSLDGQRPAHDVYIRGVTGNSSLCKSEFLFIAVKKATPSSRDGHDFIDEAIINGAGAIIVDADYKPKKIYPVPLMFAQDTKTVLCHLAEAFHDFPSHCLKIIGLTGTNGKTSTSFMLHSILKQAGFSPKVMGTLGEGDPQNLMPVSLTTMEPEFISASLAKFKREGATHVIMEVSSIGLSLKRTEAIRFSLAALTNFTQDHLDFHGTLANYQEAKARLFFELAHECTHLCLPDDHPFGLRAKKLQHLTLYGARTSAVSFTDVKETHLKTNFMLHAFGQSSRVSLPFLGDFHVKNACLAASLASALGVSLENIVLGLEKCSPIPGRLEPIQNRHSLRVFVDFAHTPDGLLSMLSAVRKLKYQRLILVFGCGGDRDATKRPLMGKIASDYADVVIVTDDNPRGELPQAIRSQILSGISNGSAQIIPDRHEAIRFAIMKAEKNDIVIIAGKGHETYQIYGDTKKHFSDSLAAKTVLDSL